MKASRLALARVFLSGIVFCLSAAFFLLPWSGAPSPIDSLPSLQLFPSIERTVIGALENRIVPGALAIVVLVIALTLVFGRLYCAFFCPLGALQDLVIHLKRTFAPAPRKAGRYAAGRPGLHAAALALVAVSALAGSSLLLGLLEPWAVFGKIAASLLVPMAILANNALAFLSRRAGSYDLAFVPIAGEAAQAVLALVVFGAIVALALARGRLFCNLLCPTGALLRLASFRPVLSLSIEGAACTRCGNCARSCPASCIDGEAGRIEESRCVRCFDCVGACPTGAISFRKRRKAPVTAALRDPPGEVVLNRRTFFRLGAGSAFAALSFGLGAGLGLILGILGRSRNPRIFRGAGARLPAAPPGALSVAAFLSACSACGACVARCPSGVIRPSNLEWGILDEAKPYLDYDRAYCQFECDLCLRVCPTGALRRIPLDTKKRSRLGRSILKIELCIVRTQKTNCGACAEHCPSGALTMVVPAVQTAGTEPRTIPEPRVEEDYCIGCGACEKVCPSKPDKAIYVEGRLVQDEAKVRGTRPGDLRDVQGPALPPGSAPGQDRAPPAEVPGGGAEGFPF